MRTRRSKAILTAAVATVAALTLLTGCMRVTWLPGDGDIEVFGSAGLETRQFDFTSFTKVEAGQDFEVDLIRADTHKVSITMNENLFEYLDASQRGELLTIRLMPGYRYQDTTLRATITLPDLRDLRLSGAARADVTGFRSGHAMRFEASGASALHLNNIEADDTTVRLSGASRADGTLKMADGDIRVSGVSNVELYGSAEDLSLNASGASTAWLADFRVRTASIEASGCSSVNLEVSDRLDVDISGLSRLTYRGSPALGSVHISSGSTLRQES